ncbi:ATP-dependent dethiobiotin synthetase BioD [Shewanella colwelliana]|uniref:ATP-dependent dethiobiotin synthetase BioD n=1 Tax=Shewanella colwelliana TaxID=23 RepID=A0ABQ4NXZ7_SHECO|nr:dethiobiotin synthase [Shewanella colwelliana]GIU39632.1 ATP-dependent dethiobiotin synthetase BioD [Shewanella colwelliana]
MRYFVTGTDTDCGKTFVSSALLHAAQARGSTLGLKPIASGCEVTPEGLRNTDALSLIAQSSVKLDYSQVNPFSFEPAIAPHIAAKHLGTGLSVDAICQHLETLPLSSADLMLVEGAGGWRLPLGGGEFLSQAVKQLSMPVILVVGVKLGCLNHAVLTQEAILADGLTLAGWVANVTDPNMAYLQENLTTLTELMASPCLGVVPYLPSRNVATAAGYCDIDALS